MGGKGWRASERKEHHGHHDACRKQGLYEELLALFQSGRLVLIFDGLDEAGKKLEDMI